MDFSHLSQKSSLQKIQRLYSQGSVCDLKKFSSKSDFYAHYKFMPIDSMHQSRLEFKCSWPHISTLFSILNQKKKKKIENMQKSTKIKRI